MPADYRIRADKGLAYVKFWGHLTMAEVMACAERFDADGENIKLYKHLIDFSGVTSYEPDVVKILETQAKLTHMFVGDPAQWIFAYLTPTPLSRELSGYGERAWSGVPSVVVRMTTSERDALEILGLSEKTIDAVLDGVTPI